MVPDDVALYSDSLRNTGRPILSVNYCNPANRFNPETGAGTKGTDNVDIGTLQALEVARRLGDSIKMKPKL